VTALTVSGVTKNFGPAQVLRGVDLHVPAESFTAVLGPSGCGKTTLLRLIAGFADPDAGSIHFGADEVFGPSRRVPPQRRRVGYVPQEGALFPHLDVAANITFGLPRRARRADDRVDELLALTGLDPSVRRRLPHELSGGQQQRVALARALAPEPSIVLLDEPFASLDAGLREDTGRAVAGALKAARATAVLVTHDQGEALSLADQVAVMRAGRLVQVGAPDQLYRFPADVGVATFVGAAVVLPATVAGDLAIGALGTLPVGPGSSQGAAQVLIRPEQLQMLPATASAGPGVRARVLEVSYYGHDAAVRLELVDGARVVARVSGSEAPPAGSEVEVVVAGRALVYEQAAGL
jgi:iron(III) transport system ATP-binding protein